MIMGKSEHLIIFSDFIADLNEYSKIYSKIT